MATRRLDTLLFVFLLGLMSIGGTNTTSFAQTPTADDSTNQDTEEDSPTADSDHEWLNELLALKTKKELLLEKQTKNDSSLNAREVTQKTIEEIDRQIKWARQTIEIDGVFSEEAHKAAMRKIREVTKAANQMKETRELLGIDGNPTKKEIDRSVGRSRRKAKNEIEAAHEKHRLAIDAAGLKFKFQTNPNKIGMVIWNLPADREIHDRQTSVVKVSLLRDDKVVWRSRNIKLDRKRANNPIELPNSMFSKVTVDVVRWQGDGGGLAEVQVFVGGENVAARRPCEVTNIETQPTHLDDQHAVTDGITDPTELGNGYWIPEEKKKASVTIDLLGVPVSPVVTDR